MCKTIAGSKLKIENLQARLSPKQEIAAFIAHLITFTLTHTSEPEETMHPVTVPKSQNSLDWVQKKSLCRIGGDRRSLQCRTSLPDKVRTSRKKSLWKLNALVDMNQVADCTLKASMSDDLSPLACSFLACLTASGNDHPQPSPSPS